MIALFQFFVPTATDTAALVVRLSFLLLIVSCSLLLHEFTKSVVFVLPFIIALLVIPYVIQYMAEVLTEISFAAFMMISVFSLLRHSRTDKLGWLILAAVFASASALTRYLGYAMLLTLWVYIGFYDFRRRKRVPESILIAVLAAIPSLAYVVRNQIVFGAPHGHSISPGFRLFGDLALTIDVLRADLGWWLVLLVILSVVVVAMRWTANRPPALLLLFVGTAYLAMTLYGTSSDRVTPIYSRYFVPLYPLVLVFIVAVLNGISHYRSLVQLGMVVLVLYGVATVMPDASRQVDYIVKRHNAHAWHDYAKSPWSATARE